jgi:hypothetical protein
LCLGDRSGGALKSRRTRADTDTTVKKLLFALAALIPMGALAGVVLIGPELYEVEDKGRGPGIVPYESGVIYKVRLLGELLLYAPEEARPQSDKVTSLALTAVTTMMLMAFLVLRAAAGRVRLRRFFACGAVGLAALTLDETFALHELLGHNLHILAGVPGVERPDDLIFALYPIAIAIFAWHFRDVLLALTKAVSLFAIGGCFFMIAVASDVIGSGADEIAEPAAVLCLAAGLVLLTADALRRELRLPRVAPLHATAAPPAQPRQRLRVTAGS